MGIIDSPPPNSEPRNPYTTKVVCSICAYHGDDCEFEGLTVEDKCPNCGRYSLEVE